MFKCTHWGYIHIRKIILGGIYMKVEVTERAQEELKKKL